MSRLMAVLVVVVVATLSLALMDGVQADGGQPCKYLKLRSGGATEAQCEDCCASNQLEMGVTFDACRCKPSSMARACPCATVHGHCPCQSGEGPHECPCAAGKCPCKAGATGECPCGADATGECPCAAGKCPCKAGVTGECPCRAHH